MQKGCLIPSNTSNSLSPSCLHVNIKCHVLTNLIVMSSVPALIPCSRSELSDPQWRSHAADLALHSLAEQIRASHPGQQIANMSMVFDGVAVYLVAD